MAEKGITTNNTEHRMGKGGGIISNSPHMEMQKGDSAMQGTAVGSGSRPTKSKFMIDTSAPEDAHTLGRDVPGSLK